MLFGGGDNLTGEMPGTLVAAARQQVIGHKKRAVNTALLPALEGNLPSW